MTEQIMMDGEPLEVGDRIYSLLYGWVTIKELHHEQDLRPIVFENADGLRTLCLKSLTYHPKHQNRDLFWQKPEIIPPPKPKKKVKVWDWVIYNLVDEPSLVLSARTETDLKEKGYLSYKKVEGTEREVIQ